MMIGVSFRFRFFLCFVLLLLLIHSICSTIVMPPMDGSLSSHSDMCSTCTQMTEKFIEGYKKTVGSNFGGGNTDWEKRKLKDYARSETRLIEIMEGACGRSDTKCSSLLEKYEDLIEEWYQSSTPMSLDNFYQWLCIDTAKVCCPKGTFGKNCRRCQYGDNGFVCSDNGKCDGDGTRSGNGRCVCDEKYSGTNCSNCRVGYTKSIDEDNEVICTDIDECRSSLFLSPCRFQKCNNTEGAFVCYGEPFYQQLSKMSVLAVLLFTVSILMYKEMHTLVVLTCMVIIALLVLFAQNRL